jgi:hypothetical protein
MDPISITGIAALDAALTGAGVGAVGGLVTGNDPLKGALLGGVAGGGGSLLGLGGGAAGGASKGINLAEFDNGVGSLASAYNTPAMGIQLGLQPTSQALGEGLSYGLTPATVSAGGSALDSMSPTFMDKLSNMPNSAFDWMKANPNATLGAGKMFADFKNPPKQQTAKTPIVGVSKGNIGQYQPLLVTEIPKQRYPHSLLLGY